MPIDTPVYTCIVLFSPIDAADKTFPSSDRVPEEYYVIKRIVRLLVRVCNKITGGALRHPRSNRLNHIMSALVTRWLICMRRQYRNVQAHMTDKTDLVVIVIIIFFQQLDGRIVFVDFCNLLFCDRLGN
jgi:hypothetical protein